jgi:nicotinate-nucleotide adenylyltransferase
VDKVKQHMQIGLFFGSFNPIHIGHLVLANYFLEFTDLDNIWFVVSPQNPFKEKSTLLNEYQRLQLVNLAIDGHPKMKASNIEFKLSKPSYTINTLVHLSEQYPQHQFTLLMGEDNLEHFHKWKNYEQILADYSIYIYPRHNYSSNLYNQLPNVKRAAAPIMEVSSTFIRDAIKHKKEMRFFMPPAVYQYIMEMHFYKK